MGVAPVHGFPTVDLPTGFGFFRVHRTSKGPVFFGPEPGAPPANRFDAPGGQYRTLYVAETLAGAVVETVLRDPGRRIIASAELTVRSWTLLRTARPLRLAKLMDEGLRWHQLDASVSAVSDYGPPRAAALALHAIDPPLDGIAYRSRHNNGLVCFALFDRVIATDLAPDGPARPLLGDPEVMATIRAHGAVLDLAPPVPTAAT